MIVVVVVVQLVVLFDVIGNALLIPELAAAAIEANVIGFFSVCTSLKREFIIFFKPESLLLLIVIPILEEEEDEVVFVKEPIVFGLINDDDKVGVDGVDSITVFNSFDTVFEFEEDIDDTLSNNEQDDDEDDDDINDDDVCFNLIGDVVILLFSLFFLH